MNTGAGRHVEDSGGKGVPAEEEWKRGLKRVVDWSHLGKGGEELKKVRDDRERKIAHFFLSEENFGLCWNLGTT